MNEHIRKHARVNDVRLWELAMELEIGEATLQRWLRQPIAEEKEKRIFAAISAVACRKSGKVIA